MLREISNDYDKTRGSYIYDATGGASVELKKVYEELDTVEAKQSIGNLADDELTKHVYERTGINRHQATFATETVLITGQPGALIKIGDRVGTESTTYHFTESTTIGDTGQVTVLVESDVSGVAGNTPATTITNFPVTLEGLTSVTNLEPVVNGYAAEADGKLRERYYEYLQSPATSGNKSHYKMWAKEVIGVGDAKVFPTWNGGGTVKVVIIDANKRAASEELITNVYNHIEEERPIGATVTVVSGSEKTISISATLILANGFNVGQVQTAFAETLVQHFTNSAFKETYISYARIGNLLLETPGVGDYSNLLVNGMTANVLLTDEEIPVLGTVTLEV